MFSKKVQIIGTGYVGLPLALLLAKNDVKVVGVDIKSEIVEQINNLQLKIGEKEIDDLFKDEKVRRNLKASLKPTFSDIFVIAVPTPIMKRRKIADLSYVKESVLSISPYLEKGNLVIIESTIPPLTCREFIKPIIEGNTDLLVNKDIFLAHCPERILPGNIYYEIINNSRIIGGMNKEAAMMAKEMYEVFVKGKIIITDDVTAELAKLVENAYRDVNIAFANEISQVAERLGIDPLKLIEMANMHPRVNILRPGIGVGGHCIAVDPWFIKEIDNDNSSLIQTARRINENRPFLIANKIRKIISSTGIRNPSVLLLGAAYKPNSSDIRESPALKIFKILKEDFFNIRIKDPLCKEYMYENIIDEVSDVDIIVILVKHKKILEDLTKVESQYPNIKIVKLF